MGKAKFQIERRCEVCGNPFFRQNSGVTILLGEVRTGGLHTTQT